MLSLVKNESPRTPSLHGEDERSDSPDRPDSPEIDVDSPQDDDSPLQEPPISPRDIKEEDEEEDEKHVLPLAPHILSPLALHLQHRPSPLPGNFPLFQPFLPMPPLLRRSVPFSTNVSPFSIDAILRPDFGNRLSPPMSLSPPASRRSPPAVSPPTSRSPRLEGAKAGDGTPTSDADCPPGMVRGPNGQLWPAWVFCTRYSDRPSSGPRLRKAKKSDSGSNTGSPRHQSSAAVADDKRPRTAFSSEQLGRLKHEFDTNRYLTEERRRSLSQDLGLNENQIKIWFQNKRAKLKKTSGHKGELAQMLSAQGLYNHSTTTLDEEESAMLGI